MDQGLAELNALVKEEPRNVRARILLGNAYLSMRNTQAASAAFEEAIRLAPERPGAYVQMGKVLLVSNRENEAIEMFEKAVSMDATLLEPVQYITAVYLKRKDFDQAVARVRRQLDVAPANPFLNNLMGSVYEAAGNLTDAEKYMKKALELEPSAPALHVSLAGFYLRHKMTEKAKTQYLSAIDKEPQTLSAHMALGLIYEGEKNYDQAQNHYEKALKINPDYVPAANNLAYLYAERGGNIDVALNLAQKAKERVPNDPHISDTLGWIYYKKNVYTTAIGYLKEAAEKQPAHPTIRYHLGMAYFKNGNRDQAKKELQEALRLNPGFEKAQEAKKTLDMI